MSGYKLSDQIQEAEKTYATLSEVGNTPGKTLADLRKEIVEEPIKEKTVEIKFDPNYAEGLEPVILSPEAQLTELIDIFNESIPNLLKIVEEVNPPERVKVIGKLKGALELFNQI